MLWSLSRLTRSAWIVVLLLSWGIWYCRAAGLSVSAEGREGASGGTASAPLAPPRPSLKNLAARLDEIIAPVARYAAVGVCVRSLDRGDELYARNADAAFVPASNQKLLIAAAALDVLGPDFRFTTQVLSLGPRLRDTLDGDLVLQGGGDPTLSTEGLGILADGVAAFGIRRVMGRVRGDDSVFDRRRYGIGWAWEDEGSADAPPISGLTLNENTVEVEVRAGPRPGSKPSVTLNPRATPISLRVRALTAPAGERGSLEVTRTHGRDEIVVSGRLAQERAPVSVRVTVTEPALYAAAVFTRLLRDRGIRVAGDPVLLGTPGSAVILRDLSSPKLSEIVSRMNKPSNNLYAEMLLKALGMRGRSAGAGTGIGGEGEAILRAFLQREGLRGPALVCADGSGLSRQNLISPRNLVQLLTGMDRHPAREPFFGSLPIAGVDGTLRRRMSGTAAAGVVRAKTGTLAHVTALSGLVTTRDGRRLVFSILTNNFPGALSEPGGPREMEDAVATELAAFSNQSVRRSAMVP